jgi:hypothetical protein
MSANISFLRPLGSGENPDNLPKYLADAGNDPYTGRKMVDLSQLAKMKIRLQSTIVEDGNMAKFERMLRGLNFGRRPDEETIREIINLEIPGQPTIIQAIYALPENEFKHELMAYLEVEEEPSLKGGKKRHSKLRKSITKSRKLRKLRKSRRTRSRRRYRK